MNRPIIDQFLKALPELVYKTETCWFWIGGATSTRYGVFKHKYAHRLSYEAFKGVEPGKMLVLHRCDNPQCINPDHLFLGTKSDNAFDYFAKGGGSGQSFKTMCQKGHPYDEQNTYIRPNGGRTCKECNRTLNRDRARDKAKKEFEQELQEVCT